MASRYEKRPDASYHCRRHQFWSYAWRCHSYREPFGLPGLGTYIADGIKFKDVPAVTGGIIVYAVLFSLIILLVDLSYAFVDPRIKAKYVEGGKAK